MLKQLVKKNTTKGLRLSLKNVITEIKISRIHLQGVRRARTLRNGTELKLHFGCGQNIKPGYINIDLWEGADLGLDLREPLPFLTDSCSMIYSEHFLEHLAYPDEAMFFVSECSRILRPGGMFRVGVPDSEWPIRAYAGDPYYADWFRYVRSVYPRSNWITTNMECVNYSFHQGEEHKFGYDFETLKRNLEIAGLTEVKRSEFDPSFDSENSRYSLDTDDTKCTTLYVNAIKP